ncbi:MAG: hypothetical protein ACO2O5_03845 [Candidatus Caldipriscus sp.]
MRYTSGIINNCGCGDGYSGTGSSWLCILDTVCSGRACYGHGRGMCQWGSSRWANRGFTWKWINEHYYCIGDTFRIDLNIQSYAEDTHNRISDPPRDI